MTYKLLFDKHRQSSLLNSFFSFKKKKRFPPREIFIAFALSCLSRDVARTHNNNIKYSGFSLRNTCHIMWWREPSHHPRSHLAAANIRTVR